MPKEAWGVKRVCPTTGKRFYDLNRDPVVSPYTGEVVPLDTGKPSRAILKEEKPKKTEETSGNTLIEDEDSVLGDNDSDVDLGDDVLDDDSDDNVSLEDIADVGGDDDET